MENRNILIAPHDNCTVSHEDRSDWRGGTRTREFARALLQPCVFIWQKDLSMYKGTAGSLQCWFGSPIGCLHQTSTPTHTHAQTQSRTRLGGGLSSEDVVLFYQHESHWLIRRGAVTVETGGDGNRWWNGTFIKESCNTNTWIPYARMQPHELSIKHNTHNKHRGVPPENQQPIRIIWLGWWEACPICSHCHHKRASLSASTHTPSHTASARPVWV